MVETLPTLGTGWSYHALRYGAVNPPPHGYSAVNRCSHTPRDPPTPRLRRDKARSETSPGFNDVRLWTTVICFKSHPSGTGALSRA